MTDTENDAAEEPPSFENLATSLLDAAPPHVQFVAVVCLLDCGDEYPMGRGHSGRAFAIDTSAANRTHRADPTFQAGAAACRKLADDLDRAFQAAGYSAVSLNLVHLDKAGKS